MSTRKLRPAGDEDNDSGSPWYPQLNESVADDNTLIATPLSPNHIIRRLVLDPVDLEAAIPSGATLTFRTNAGRVGDQINCTVRFYDEAGVVVAERDFVQLASTHTAYTVTLTADEIAALANAWAVGVRVEFDYLAVVAPPPMDRRLIITRAQLEVPAVPVADSRLIITRAQLSIPPVGGSTPLDREEHPRLIFTLDNIAEKRAHIIEHWTPEFTEWVDYVDAEYALDITTLGWKKQCDMVLHFACLATLGVGWGGFPFTYTADQYRTRAMQVLAQVKTDQDALPPLTTGGNENKAYWSLRWWSLHLAFDWLHDYFVGEWAYLKPWLIAKMSYRMTNFGTYGSETGLETSQYAQAAHDLIIAYALDAEGATVRAAYGSGLVYGIKSGAPGDGYEGALGAHNWNVDYAPLVGGNAKGWGYTLHDDAWYGWMYPALEGRRTALDLTFEQQHGAAGANIPYILSYFRQPIVRSHETPGVKWWNRHMWTTNADQSWDWEPTGHASVGNFIYMTHYLAANLGLTQHNEFLQWVQDHVWQNNDGNGPRRWAPGNDGNYWVPTFLCGQKYPTGNAKGPVAQNWPLSHYNHNLGWYVSRTAWEDPLASCFTFESRTWTTRGGTYSHFANGSWGFARNGPGVLHRSGDGPHCSRYSSRGVAGNVFVFDLGGTSGEEVQREVVGFPDFKAPSTATVGDAHYVGGIHRKADHPQALYVHGDVSRSYDGEQTPQRNPTDKFPKRLTRWTRSLVWFKAQNKYTDIDVVVCYDRVDTMLPTCRKTQLTHYPWVDPVFTCESTTPLTPKVTRGDDGEDSGFGRTTYLNVTQVDWAETSVIAPQVQFDCKSRVSILRPAVNRVVQIAGPNEDGKYNEPHTSGRRSITAISAADFDAENRMATVTTGTAHPYLPRQHLWVRACPTAQFNKKPTVVYDCPTTTTFRYKVALDTPDTAVATGMTCHRAPSWEAADKWRDQPVDGYRAAYPNPGKEGADVSEWTFMGKGRFELEPQTFDRQDHDFLTVYQAMPSAVSAQIATELTATGAFVAVECANTIAVFGAQAAVSYPNYVEARVTAGTFTIPRAGTFRVVIADLPASTQRTISGSATITDLDGLPGPFIATDAGSLALRIITTGATVITVS